MRKHRGGTTLLEILVVLFIGGIVAHMGASLLVAQRGAVERMVRRSDVLATVRQTRHTLGWEIRGGHPRRDAWRVGSDALDLRAFRGAGWVCSVDGDGLGAVVVVEGVRRPDARKDSVVALGAAGGAAVVGLRSDGALSGGCGAIGSASAALPPGVVRRWTVSEPLPPGTSAVRYFERGRYHLARGALRYVRGRSGLQPLTPEALGDPPGGFELLPWGGVGVSLYPRTKGYAGEWRVVASHSGPVDE